MSLKGITILLANRIKKYGYRALPDKKKARYKTALLKTSVGGGGGALTGLIGGQTNQRVMIF